MVLVLLDALLLAAAAAGAAWLLRALVLRTRRGLAHQQRANAVAIDDAVARTCTIHGEVPAEAMVRAANGTLVCPACYRARHAEAPSP